MGRFNVFWSCLDTSIQLFISYLDDKGEEKYSYSDIQSILYKVLKKKQLAKKVFSAFLLLKDLSFFQEGDFLYTSDIVVLKNTLYRLKKIFFNLYPYRKILFFSNTHSVSYKDYYKAQKVLLKAFESIGDIFASTNASYTYQSLEGFLKLFSSKSKEVTDFVFLLKGFITNNPNRVILKKDWLVLTSSAASLYSAYRGFRLFFINNKTPNFLTLKAQFQHYQAVEALILDNLNKQELKGAKPSVYRIEDIKRLILQYQKISSSKFIINSSFLDSVWNSIHDFLSKNMYAQQNLKFTNQAFTSKHLLSLKSLALRWFYVQNLNLNFLGFTDRYLFLKDKLSIKYRNKIVWELNLTSIYERFSGLFVKNIGKRKVDYQGRLVFSSTYNSHFLWNNLTRLNHESLLVDLVFFRYAGPDLKADLLELNTAFDQFKSVFISAKILAPETANIPETIYRESNLFMPSSKPDGAVDKQEALEYLHYIFSGLNIKNNWANLTEKNCASYKQDLDTFYKTTCVYSQFLKNKKQYFSFLPKIKQLGFLKNSVQWFKTLSVVAGHKDGEVFKKKNMFKMGMLLQYIMTVFSRFDLNQDFKLNYFESLGFFPLVKEALQSFLPVEDPLELQNLYIYLLKHGVLPNYELDPLSELRVFSWSLKEDKSYEVSFFQFLKVFKSLRSFSM